MTMNNEQEPELEVQLSVASPDMAYLVLNTPGGTAKIPPHAVIGAVSMAQNAVAWSSFRANPAFVKVLSEYMMGSHGIAPAGLDEASVAPGERFVVIDQRCSNPDGAVAPEDILGSYATDHAGRPVRDTFEYNQRHRLVRSDGALSRYLEERRFHRLIAKLSADSASS